MAKVNMPLGSFTARGQLAKALVYSTWKGIDYVRKYVNPANPNTPLQQVSRAEFRDAVDTFHISLFTDIDLSAWRRSAGALTRIMSGFNNFVSRYIDLVTPVLIWEPVQDMLITIPVSGSIDIDIAGFTGGGADVWWGTSKTYMPNQVALVYAGGRYSVTIPGFTPGVRYYFRVIVQPANVGESGIYEQIAT